jgi:hypothetical protein
VNVRLLVAVREKAGACGSVVWELPANIRGCLHVFVCWRLHVWAVL